MWSTVDYLRAMFDESLPVPPIAQKAAIVWVFVAEEARPYLASPVGKRETLRTVTQGRKEGFGFIGISQRVEDFDGIGREFLPQRVITPFLDPDYARNAFAAIGIDPDEYPHVLDTRTYAGHAYAYFIDEQGRTGLVDLLPPAQPQLVRAFDTTDMDSVPVDFGRNGQAPNGQVEVR